jgi:ABC-2 type transport system ATP-binding protein
MIETKGIVKRFGRVTAVDRASFSVPGGAICGFLGPNGAGKTTTIRMLVGALAPDDGELWIDGMNPAALGAQVRRRVGYLAEESPVHPELTVEEFVGFRARLYGVPRRERAKAVSHALDRCQIQDVRRRLCGQLSKGYRQRCGLAAAIAHSPRVIVLDEPTSGLDPAQVLEFRKLLRELSQQATVLLSSHILAEVEAVCDRAVLIHQGRVAAQGSLAQLRAQGASAAQLVVETERDLAAELAVLPGAHGVESTRMSDGWWKLRVHASGSNADLAQAVGAAAMRSGSTVRRLEWQEATLESIFHALMRGQENL